MKTLATLAFVILVAGPAVGQTAEMVLRDAYQRLDRNGDGRVERAEFPGSDAQFEALGAGADGAVSAEEFGRSPLGRQLVAARVADASQPRARADADALLERRIAAAERLDANRDGEVTPAEWTGDTRTFAELDLDADGDLDRADRAQARRRAPGAGLAPQLPDFDSGLGGLDRLREELDRDGDGAISAQEARGNRLEAAFPWADLDRDGGLEAAELERLARAIAEQLRARDRGDGRPTAYRVPFSSWDDNGDRRIELAEWKGPKYLFPRIDADRDAALSEAEVARYVRSVEGTTFFERFDLDDDGRVTPAEFGGPPATFRRADRDGDGSVTNGDR